MTELMIPDYEHEPPQSTAPAHVMVEGDPLDMVLLLEQKADLAPRMKAAIEKMLVGQTYPGDWSIQGNKACLDSAGAERVGMNFPIKYEDVEHEKKEFKDEVGEWYAYLYTGYAILSGRKVFAQGIYSSREKFLGFKDEEWRPLSEINEDHIRSAAYHIFCGNAIKQLFGLRGIPVKEYNRIMKSTGRDPGESANVERGKGTQGGSSADDHQGQKEFGEICMAIANAGHSVAKDENGNYYLRPLSEDDPHEALEIAKDICLQLSSFPGSDGKQVKGKNSAKELRGKWLLSTLPKARALFEMLSEQTADAPDNQTPQQSAADDEANAANEFLEAVDAATLTTELDDYELKLAERTDISDAGKRKVLEVILAKRKYLTRGERSNKKPGDLFSNSESKN